MKSGFKVWPIALILLAVILTVLIIMDTGQPSITASSYPVFKSQFDVIIPRLMKRYNVPGVAIAFIQEGEVDYVKGYGWADKEKKIPVTGFSEFQVASNSKTLAAWGVMKLAQEGKLDLDTPVDKYLTRWHLPVSKYDNNQVTIRRILSHTAGLSQGGYAGYPPEARLPRLEDSLSGKVKGVQELKVVVKPGTKYRYSGGGYTLLQLVVEEVTGKPFAQYMADEILIPLGMTNSSYIPNQNIRAMLARGYDVLGYTMPNYIYTETAAAGLYTSAADLARFVAANIDGKDGATAGRGILNKTTLSQMLLPIKKDYGLGYIQKNLPNGDKLVYHGGANRGWRTQFAFIPQKGSLCGDGLVALTNSENGENLHRDLVSLWVKWETGYWPDFHMKDVILRIIIKVAALLLALFLLVNILRTFIEIKKKRQVFVFAYEKLTFGIVCQAVLKCVLALFLAVIWWIVFYTGLIYGGWTFASFAPAGFIWVTVVVLIWSIFLFMKSWFVIKCKV